MQQSNRQLTKNFSFFELTRTDHAEYQERNRDLTEEQVGKLLTLAHFMEFIRMIIGRPIIVHSGYRCPELNTAVGSLSASQHVLAEACDFHAEDLTPEEAFNLIVFEAPFLVFGQLALEDRYGKIWVHISVKGNRPPEKCGQIMRIKTQ